MVKEYLPIAVAVSTVVAAPLVVGAAVSIAGFGSVGIVAGSMAAKLMSATAIANGGTIAAGSTVAVLQSVGAAGIALKTSALLAGAAGGTTALVQKLWK